MAKTNKTESYDKNQCIYGEDSAMVCSLCSAVCTSRMASTINEKIKKLNSDIKKLNKAIDKRSKTISSLEAEITKFQNERYELEGKQEQLLIEWWKLNGALGKNKNLKYEDLPEIITLKLGQQWASKAISVGCAAHVDSCCSICQQQCGKLAAKQWIEEFGLSEDILL